MWRQRLLSLFPAAEREDIIFVNDCHLRKNTEANLIYQCSDILDWLFCIVSAEMVMLELG